MQPAQKLQKEPGPVPNSNPFAERLMKKSMLTLAAVATLGAMPLASYADDMFSFNVGAVTDYRYRGISQTRLKPALQGGIDATLPEGFYVGTWASTIKWINDWERAAGTETGGSVEWDIYGGWKKEVAKDLTLDVGVLRYQYVGNHLANVPGFANANTTELYGALSYGVFTAKYSHSITNLFGTPDSKNSGYIDLSANFDIGNGFTLTPHIGYQSVSHNGNFSYTDYSLGVSKEFVKGLSVSLAAVGTDTKTIGGVKAYASPANGKDLGKASLVAGVKYSF
jgi:uncharacterized protein (TIGR02001 family)